MELTKCGRETMHLTIRIYKFRLSRSGLRCSPHARGLAQKKAQKLYFLYHSDAFASDSARSQTSLKPCVPKLSLIHSNLPEAGTPGRRENSS